MNAPEKINGRFFDSDQYWLERGPTYREVFEANSLRHKIPFWIQEYYIDKALEWIKRLQEPRIILDAGCGFGRITKRLCRKFPYARIYGLDISEDQIAEARKELPRVDFKVKSLTEHRQFGGMPLCDLTTISEVLMHIPPGDRIRTAIANVARRAPEFILTVDWYDPHDPPETEFCFQHAYEPLFMAQGYDLFNEKKIPFVAQKIRIWRPQK